MRECSSGDVQCTPPHMSSDKLLVVSLLIYGGRKAQNVQQTALRMSEQTTKARTSLSHYDLLHISYKHRKSSLPRARTGRRIIQYIPADGILCSGGCRRGRGRESAGR